MSTCRDVGPGSEPEIPPKLICKLDVLAESFLDPEPSCVGTVLKRVLLTRSIMSNKL